MPTEINIHDPVRRLKFENGAVVDHELNSLGKVLGPVQEALDKVRAVSDPEGHGYLDAADYLVGVAMVAAQRYMSSSCRAERVSKNVGLGLGPIHESGVPVVALLNDVANAWKHRDEWAWAEPDRRRDQTAAVFDLLEDGDDWYPYANVVYRVLGDVSAGKLVEVLVEWRDALEVEGAKMRV